MRVVMCVLGVAVALAVPSAASGETLMVSPGSGPAGTVVRMTYSMNGGCGQGEVAEFFFDANPVGRARVDQQSCRAVLRYTVPATSCTTHSLTAAWHYPGAEQLYGLASSRFSVTRRGSTCRTPPTAVPSPTRAGRSPRPVPVATSAPPPTRRPVPRQSVVPVVTSAPPTSAGRVPEDGSGGGAPLALWALGGLGLLSASGLLIRRHLRHGA